MTPFSVILAVMPEDTAIIFFQWHRALPEGRAGGRRSSDTFITRYRFY